jgi:hypothetical protein
MKEKSALLGNMSSSSRSMADVRPRRFDPPAPPPTEATGKKIRGDVGAAISLRVALTKEQAQIDLALWEKARLDEGFLVELLCGVLDPAQAAVLTLESERREWLRTLADQTIREHKLIGCVMLTQLRSREVRLQTLPPRLAFSLLSKSSERLFIASKTPNLTINVIEREFQTFDPRIVALTV